VTAGTGPAAPPPTAAWADLARHEWAVLQRRCVRPLPPAGVYEPRGLRRVPLWPFSQVLHAGGLVEGPGSHASLRLLRMLEAYRWADGWAERPRARRRYYDDVAWVVLALLDLGGDDAARLARRAWGFLLTGVVDVPGRGTGLRWVEGSPTLHACSTGAVGLAAARWRGAGGPPSGLATGCADLLLSLRGTDGLVGDHLRPDGSIYATAHAYNQGLLVGLLGELGRAQDAVDAADRAMGAFPQDVLWRHPAAFDAILVRELVRLPVAEGRERRRQYAEAWARRVLREARDPATGLLAHGLTRYGSGVVLDHAAVITALAELSADEG
jgi:hypothetical protein